MITGDKNKSNILLPDMIYLHRNISTREEAIRLLINQAEAQHLITDNEQFYQAVLVREREASTAIGEHIAIPHGKTDVVNSPFIGFLRSSEPFRWSNDSSEDVQLVFMIGVAKKNENKLHLKIISQLSKKLLDEEFKHKLMTYSSEDDVFDLLNAIIKKID